MLVILLYCITVYVALQLLYNSLRMVPACEKSVFLVNKTKLKSTEIKSLTRNLNSVSNSVKNLGRRSAVVSLLP